VPVLGGLGICLSLRSLADRAKADGEHGMQEHRLCHFPFGRSSSEICEGGPLRAGRAETLKVFEIAAR
jgi:hypothetical protein